MGFFTESVDRPYVSRIAAEDIDVGTLVTENGSDAYRRAEATDNRISHLAARPRRADYIAFDEDDTLSSFTYDSADDDRVPGQPLVDGDLIKVYSAEDNGTDPSADIQDGDSVGVAGVGGSEFEGRVVEEGYTDNGGTTYGDTTAGDFLELGTAVKDSATSFGELVRVRVNRQNKSD